MKSQRRLKRRDVLCYPKQGEKAASFGPDLAAPLLPTSDTSEVNDSDSNLMQFSPTPNSSAHGMLENAGGRRQRFGQTNEVRYG